MVNRRDLSNCDGECDDPRTPNKEIRINRNLKGVRLLEVCIHEALHAASFEQWSEEFVASLARELAVYLWRLGYQTDRSGGALIKN